MDLTAGQLVAFNFIKRNHPDATVPLIGARLKKDSRKTRLIIAQLKRRGLIECTDQKHWLEVTKKEG